MKYLLIIVILVTILITAGCVGENQNTCVTPTPQIIYVTVLVTPNITPQTASPAYQIIPTPYTDPYPDALPLKSAYHIENAISDLRYTPSQDPNESFAVPSSTKNDVSIQIIKAALWDSYTVQTSPHYQTVGPFADKKYLLIFLEITNYAGNVVIISPDQSNFKVIYDGKQYLPANLKDPIQAAGYSYKSESIARNEKTGGVILYEVPSSLMLNRTYITLIYDTEDEKNPVWRLQ